MISCKMNLHNYRSIVPFSFPRQKRLSVVFAKTQVIIWLTIVPVSKVHHGTIDPLIAVMCTV